VVQVIRIAKSAGKEEAAGDLWANLPFAWSIFGDYNEGTLDTLPAEVIVPVRLLDGETAGGDSPGQDCRAMIWPTLQSRQSGQRYYGPDLQE
jgi:hypothetical protein